MMNYYSVKIKKIKRRSVYYFILLLFFFNSVLFSFVFLEDYIYSKRIHYAYENTLTPKTKKILAKDLKQIKVKTFIKEIIQKEYQNYYVMTLFIEFLNQKNIKQEIKSNLIVYSIDIFNQIKPSSLLLDLKAYIYDSWGYPKEDIEKIIKTSLDIDPFLMNHYLFFKKHMIKHYSDYILTIYTPKTLNQKTSFFNYLIQTHHYQKIIDYIEKNDLNISFERVNRNIAINITKIGDFKKSEVMLLSLIKKNNLDYLYYYLSKLYKENGQLGKAIEALEKMKKTVKKYKRSYLLELSELYYHKKAFKKAINAMFNTSNQTIRSHCKYYVRYVRALPLKERGAYLERVKHICDKPYIYRILMQYYKKIGDKTKSDLYELELNIMK